MAAWLRLLLVILAAIESTISQHTEPQYISLGYFKKSNKVLDSIFSQDYQETVQELARINRDYREIADGFNRKNSKTLDDGEIEISQDYQNHINSLSPLVSKRRVRSQRNRREKLNLQSVRSHRAHSLESGRRRRLQPNLPHILPED